SALGLRADGRVEPRHHRRRHRGARLPVGDRCRRRAADPLMAGAPPQRPVVEWVVGIASALIVAALTAYLIHRAAFDDPTPALLEVALERVETTDQGLVIRIKLTNRGDTAAAAIAVSATPPDPALRKQI